MVGRQELTGLAGALVVVGAELVAAAAVEAGAGVAWDVEGVAVLARPAVIAGAPGGRD